jgi:peroxiredoxin
VIKNKDFLILAIATFKDTPEKVKSNANYNNLPFPAGFDSYESSSIIRQFYGPQSTISVPYDILIGRDGKVLKAHVGYDKETLDEMKELILREL